MTDNRGNVSEELARLAELRDKGVLTEAEFEAQKRAVLASPAATAPAPAASPAEKKKRSAAAGCVGLVALIVVILVIVAVLGGGSKKGGGNSSAASDATAEPPLEVTSRQLAQAYSDNEAAAQQQYGGRPLLVSGTVQGVDLGITNKASVLLDGVNEFMHAQAALADDKQDQAPSLHKGQKVKLLCSDVQEVVSIPMLSDCAVQ